MRFRVDFIIDINPDTYPYPVDEEGIFEAIEDDFRTVAYDLDSVVVRKIEVERY